MVKNRELAIFLFTTFFVCLAFMFNYFEPLEVKTQDYRFRSGLTQEVSKNVVLVAITDEDLQTYGPWPFKRSLHGKLIDFLKGAGATSIGFDIIFSQMSADDTDDAVLIKSLKNAGNVVLANKIIPSEDLIDSSTIKKTFIIDDANPVFKKAARHTAFVNVDFEFLSPDGVIRNIELFKDVKGERHYSLALRVAEDLIRKKTGTSAEIEISADYLRIGPNWIPLYNFFSFEGFKIQRHPCFIAKYNSSPKSGGFPSFSYSEIFSGLIPAEYFKDKAVIVGAQTGFLPDIKVSPLGAVPGMDINAQIVDNIVQSDFVNRPDQLSSILLTLLLGFLTYTYLVRREPAFIDIAALSAYIAVVLWIDYKLYVSLKILAEVVCPLAEVVIVAVATRFYQLFIKLHLTNISLTVSNRNLEQKVAELSALYDISKTITTVAEIKALFGIILEKTVNVVGACYGTIIMIDEDDGGLKTKIELDGRSRDTTPVLTVANESIKNKKTLILNRNHDLAGNEKLFNQMTDVTSLICIPLNTYKGDLIGIIILINKQSGENFDENDMQITSVIAVQAGFAIENANLYQLAVFDNLTTLYVRRYFLGVITKEFKRVRRYSGDISVVMTDIDHFKKFNDTYGHQTGDLVLREVALIVKKTVRETDVAARYGGEEFIIALPETDTAGAMIFAERLRKAVDEHTVPGETGPLKVNISLGVATFSNYRNDPKKSVTPQYKDIEEFIGCADLALYHSKDSGRNRATMYNTNMKEKSK